MKEITNGLSASILDHLPHEDDLLNLLNRFGA